MIEHQGKAYLSPTYLLTSVKDFVASTTYRMLADGMLLQDIRRVEAEVTDWRHWCAFFIGLARAHEQLARQSLADNHPLTASTHLVRAALCAHYGQFLYFEFPEIKRQAVELKTRLYREAASLMKPPAHPMEIAFRQAHLPGYLRYPTGKGPFPLAIILGGLDAAKEDMHQFASLCLERGLATLVFDGPGQGEAYYRGFYLGPDFHKAVSAAIDTAAQQPAIDAERIGILGRSLGGYLAPEAAAHDKRIKACVCWGALYDLGSFDDKPPLIRDGYRFLTGASDWGDAKARASWITLKDVARDIKCPLYVVHGEKDNSVPADTARRLAREAGGPSQLWIVPDSIHCNHEVAHVVRPAMADWLAEQLT
jgi:2,6-dihydroxypseudooxynicotine hydrolase